MKYSPLIIFLVVFSTNLQSNAAQLDSSLIKISAQIPDRSNRIIHKSDYSQTLYFTYQAKIKNYAVRYLNFSFKQPLSGTTSVELNSTPYLRYEDLSFRVSVDMNGTELSMKQPVLNSAVQSSEISLRFTPKTIAQAENVKTEDIYITFAVGLSVKN
ncbi:hypothetical protein ACPV5O_26775 [Vibrio maritimus]|uniref:hypothetical protein n=1 Tax=Vibrio maritimus TaxID=990268 RepID=UPI0040684491